LVDFVTDSEVTLVDAAASDDMVALAAWVSNGNDDVEKLQDQKRVAGLIKFLYRNRHMSPFEHGHFTFRIDTPIFVAREFMRHRTFSFNEVSGRYTEMKPRFYVPSTRRPIVQSGKIGDYSFEEGEEHQYFLINSNMTENCENAWSRYMVLKDCGVANEVARMVLPLNLMTQFYATVDPRNLMHFLSLRNEAQALYEIRSVAEQMEKYFADIMPLTYDAFKER
jgi:thymidylate synthase (FAD)